MKKELTGLRVPQFLLKLYHIVNIPKTDFIVSWNDTGDKIILKNETLFVDQLMGKYFKMELFTSFKR